MLSTSRSISPIAHPEEIVLNSCHWGGMHVATLSFPAVTCPLLAECVKSLLGSPHWGSMAVTILLFLLSLVPSLQIM